MWYDTQHCPFIMPSCNSVVLYCGVILSSQVVSLHCKSVVANFCAAMDTLIDQDAAACERISSAT